MLTLTIGSFALAINHLLLILALALATLVGWRVAKRGGENPESVLFSLFLLGLLAARIGFVIGYWRYFENDPLQMLDLRDGGFLMWPGLFSGPNTNAVSATINKSRGPWPHTHFAWISVSRDMI